MQKKWFIMDTVGEIILPTSPTYYTSFKSSHKGFPFLSPKLFGREGKKVLIWIW